MIRSEQKYFNLETCVEQWNPPFNNIQSCSTADECHAEYNSQSGWIFKA